MKESRSQAEFSYRHSLDKMVPDKNFFKSLTNVPHPQTSNRMKVFLDVFTSGPIFPPLAKHPVKEWFVFPCLGEHVRRHYPCIILKQTDISCGHKGGFSRTCNIKSKCCIPLLTIDSDDLGANHHKYQFSGEYLFQILRYRSLKLPKNSPTQYRGLKKGVGLNCLRDHTLKTTRIWEPPTVACLKNYQNNLSRSLSNFQNFRWVGRNDPAVIVKLMTFSPAFPLEGIHQIPQPKEITPSPDLWSWWNCYLASCHMFLYHGLNPSINVILRASRVRCKTPTVVSTQEMPRSET